MRLDPRRIAPRVRVNGLCRVVTLRGDLHHAALLDVSALGLRLERPFHPISATRALRLELELPGVGEVVRAHGEVVFAQLYPAGSRQGGGQAQLMWRAGVRFTRIGARERRLLRDYVIELRRRQRHDPTPLAGRSPREP